MMSTVALSELVGMRSLLSLW